MYSNPLMKVQKTSYSLQFCDYPEKCQSFNNYNLTSPHPPPHCLTHLIVKYVECLTLISSI